MVLMQAATFEQILLDKENLERILDNLMEGIIAHDTRRRILFFNRMAEQITGHSRKDVLGRDCHEVFGEPFCGERCLFCNDPPPLWRDAEYALNIVRKEGDPRRIEMKVTGMKDQEGRFAGVLAAFRDVTDLVGLKIRLGDLTSFSGIIGRDFKMLELFKQIQDLATNDYPVHISGETGTGKELVAQAIHNESRRGGGSFVPINCGALPEGLLESELFGHVKGAFTGAVRDKKGRFELAHGGTIFLDEVGDLPKVVQVKLLRILQEGRLERVGGETTTKVDVRIISATNLDLKMMVKQKKFREDLFYRINVVPIHIPPLRERKGDIPLLVDHFLKQAVEEGQRTTGISQEALAALLEYSWPGNVRELQSALRFALVKGRGGTLVVGNLPIELRGLSDPSRASCGPPKKLNAEGVRRALAEVGGNKAKAARLLGVGRATLYRFLADHPDVS
jgi:sigma-54 dependent transcriptional regulator, acetoin dehydrogenase operon transcriptional activator AcoR